MRINAIRPTPFTINRNAGLSISSVDKIDISLEELNFCLEYDEKGPVWVRLILIAKLTRAGYWIRQKRSHQKTAGRDREETRRNQK